MTNERLLTPKEVARIFRIRDAKIYTYIHRGWLTAINVSTTTIPKFRIDPSEIPKLKDRLRFGTSKPAKPRRSRVSKEDAAELAQAQALIDN